jgi:hypothetical protein
MYNLETKFHIPTSNSALLSPSNRNLYKEEGMNYVSTAYKSRAARTQQFLADLTNEETIRIALQNYE